MLDNLDPQDFEETAKSVVLSCADATDARAKAKLLADAGLLGILAPEEAGGLGLPLEFAVPLTAAAGEGLLGFSLVETIVLARVLAAHNPDAAKQIVSGGLLCTIAWSGVAEDGVVAGAPMGEDADQVLIFRKDGSAVLAPFGNSIQSEPGNGLDIDVPEAVIRISGPVEGIELDADAVALLRHDALLLRSALVWGSAVQCLELAASYAQQRSQFGKPLSANQAIRHRLARNVLAIETMKNALTRALSGESTPDLSAAEAAWLGAAKPGIAVGESAIQIFGGMGFTWDVPLHRHLRQMQAHSAYGSAAEHMEDLGARLVTIRSNGWYAEIEQ